MFRVRVVTEDSEGLYSPQSDELTTLPSLAHELRNFSECVRGETSPSIYTIPITEIADARNENAKTRKMEIGKYYLFQIFPLSRVVTFNIAYIFYMFDFDWSRFVTCEVCKTIY